MNCFRYSVVVIELVMCELVLVRLVMLLCR